MFFRGAFYCVAFLSLGLMNYTVSGVIMAWDWGFTSQGSRLNETLTSQPKTQNPKTPKP